MSRPSAMTAVHGPAITFGWAVVLWGWYAVFRFLDTSTYPAVAAARKNCKLLSKNKEPPFWTMAQNNIRNHIMVRGRLVLYIV